MLWAFVARKEESWSYQFFFLWNVCCNNNSGNNFESTNYEKVKKVRSAQLTCLKLFLCDTHATIVVVANARTPLHVGSGFNRAARSKGG